MPRTKPPKNAPQSKRTKPAKKKEAQGMQPSESWDEKLGRGKHHIMSKEEEEARELRKSVCGPRGIYPMGGHMIDPPSACEHLRFAKDGGVWVDLGCCQTACLDHCKIYMRYKRMNEDARRTREIARGVKNIETSAMRRERLGCANPDCGYFKKEATRYCCDQCRIEHAEAKAKPKKKKSKRTK